MGYFSYLRSDQAFNFVANPSVVLTPSSEASGYVVEDIGMLPISKPWRSTGTTLEQILIDFGSNRAIDMCALINHNLSPSAVIKVRAGTIPGASAFKAAVMGFTPNAYWRLGESSEALPALDDSGNGISGTYQPGGELVGVSGGPAGDENTAVFFNGTTGRVTVGNHALLNLSSNIFTIGMGVKLAAFAGDYTLISKDLGAPRVYIENATGLVVVDMPGTGTIAKSTIPITLNVWNLIVWTKNGATNKIYLNGVDRTGTVTNQTVTSTASGLILASYAGGLYYLPGSLDEVFIIPSALSSGNAAALYTAWSTDYNQTMTWREFDAWASFAGTIARYWRIGIQDPSNTDGFIQVGYVMMGARGDLAFGFDNGWQKEYRPVNLENRSDAGVLDVERLYKLRSYSMTWNELTTAQATTLVDDFLDQLDGAAEPLLVIPNNSLYDGIFARLTAVPIKTYKSWRQTTIAGRFTEESRGVIAAA